MSADATDPTAAETPEVEGAGDPSNTEAPAQPEPVIAAPTPTPVPAPAPANATQPANSQPANSQPAPLVLSPEELEAKIAEALEAERARVAEEARLAALSEAEREAELQVKREKELRAEREEIERSISEARAERDRALREAEIAGRQRDFATAVAQAPVRLIANDDALRRLAFDETSALVASGLTYDAALAEVAKVKPWMFVTADAATVTSTGSNGPGARVAPVQAPTRLQPLASDDDYRTVIKMVRDQQRRP